MKSCKAHGNPEKERGDVAHNSRKRQLSKLSVDIDHPNPTTTEYYDATKPLQGQETEKKSRKNLVICTQTSNDSTGEEPWYRNMKEFRMNESKTKTFTLISAKRIHDDNRIQQLPPNPHNSIEAQAQDSYLKRLLETEDLKFHVQRQLDLSPVKGQQDTCSQMRSLEDSFHHDAVGVRHDLPYLTIEVGEPLPLTSSTENVLDPSVDFQPLTSLPSSPSIFPELPIEDPGRSSRYFLSLPTAGRYIESNHVAQQRIAQQILHTHPMSRLSLPFVPPFRRIDSPPWIDTFAFLRMKQLSVLKSLREKVTTSNRILIPPGIVTNKSDQAAYTRNQKLQDIGIIHDATALNGTQINSNIPNPESLSTYRALHHLNRPKSFGVGIPQSLPFSLAHPEDSRRLSPFQVLLRQQIEVFSATEDDVLTHPRGRNKPITLKQVGIRCRHCANLTLNSRKKGSVYFPFTVMGIYQSSQRMAFTHFVQDNCNIFSSKLKTSIVQRKICKSAAGSGKEYWADAVRCLGLLDTDHGISFVRDLAIDN